MNFYKRHLGDIAKSCSDLSQGQMGAYDLLLDWHYANEKPLPLASDKLYRIARAVTQDERDNVDTVLTELFTQTDSGYTHKRAAEEMAKASAQADTNRRIAEEREERKRATNEARSVHEPFNESCTKRQPSQTPDSRQEQTSTTMSVSTDCKTETAVEQEHPKRVIPTGAILAAYHERLPMLTAVRKMTDNRKRKLKARWCEDPERQTVEYWDKFFAYVADSDFLTGRDNRWSSCDFEWLIESENHIKVIEGKYENRAHT